MPTDCPYTVNVHEVHPAQFIKVNFSTESKVPQYVSLKPDNFLIVGLREELFKRKENDPIDGFVSKKLKVSFSL